LYAKALPPAGITNLNRALLSLFSFSFLLSDSNSIVSNGEKKKAEAGYG
jgi:hypothetical protein